MLKLLGLLDLCTAFFFMLAQWDVTLGLASFFGILFILKSLIFIRDWASIIDLISGTYLFFVIYDIHTSLSLIFILWMIQKGIFSLIF